MTTFTTMSSHSYNPYYLLRVYTYYRALLGSLLLLLFQNDIALTVLGSEKPELFFYTASCYTLLNIVTLLVMWRVKTLPSQGRLFSLLGADIIAIGLMIYSSGGISNGLAYLMLVAVAAAGTLLKGRLVLFYAACACLIVIGESFLRFFSDQLDTHTLFSAASLSSLIFIIAIIFQHLTRKIISSAKDAEKQASHAAHLQKLAQVIVERMRTGIVVFNSNHQVEMFNQSAINLFDLKTADPAQLSLEDFPELKQKLIKWEQQHGKHAHILTVDKPVTDQLRINFAALTPGEYSETLVFVEDNRTISQHAQQLKLASLGRLTASIAHEIRNPLGAISHASQLLAESTDLDVSDQRLIEIINAHCKRVNLIIENVLQLSRRRVATPQQIYLNSWLREFIDEYSASQKNNVVITINFTQPHIVGQFDPSHLQQVLTNLCDNGLRYSQKKTGYATLNLECGIEDRLQCPFIKVIDDGSGIDSEGIKHLFEPFFTTENTGSGLGLFLCKELCEANQAIISYQPTNEQRSCFYLQLAHPARAL